MVFRKIIGLGNKKKVKNNDEIKFEEIEKNWEKDRSELLKELNQTYQELEEEIKSKPENKNNESLCIQNQIEGSKEKLRLYDRLIVGRVIDWADSKGEINEKKYYIEAKFLFSKFNKFVESIPNKSYLRLYKNTINDYKEFISDLLKSPNLDNDIRQQIVIRSTGSRLRFLKLDSPIEPKKWNSLALDNQKYWEVETSEIYEDIKL